MRTFWFIFCSKKALKKTIISTKPFESDRLTKITSLESCDLENFLRKVVFSTHHRINVESCLSRLISYV
eukprot:UN11557